MNKLHHKDFSIAFKAGSDANKSKFKKEAVQGEMYFATDSKNLYVAETTAGLSDATLSQFTPSSAYTNAYSLDLDGTNDFISIPSNITGSSYSTQDWTFSMFFKADASHVSSSAGLTVFLAGTGSSPYIGFYQGNIRYVNFAGSGANGPALTGGWQHLMITNDSSTGSSNDAASLYIDGSFVGYTRTWNNCAGIRNIGQWYSGYNSNLIVDEISIFDSVKSVSDVQTAGVPNDLTSLNPVLWYRCGDGDTSPTLTNNGSGSSLDGTMNNITTFSSDVPS
jgi:hypothetical protein